MKQIVVLPDQLGPLLQAARKAAGLSQTTLAARLGLSQSRLSAMERDPSTISVAQLLALLGALGLELAVQDRALAAREPSRWEW
jgi:HTH-type transcriptional regulator/antitoxin HipB